MAVVIKARSRRRNRRIIEGGFGGLLLGEVLVVGEGWWGKWGLEEFEGVIWKEGRRFGGRMEERRKFGARHEDM